MSVLFPMSRLCIYASWEEWITNDLLLLAWLYDFLSLEAAAQVSLQDNRITLEKNVGVL